MADRILIPAGARIGHAKLANDAEFRAKLAEGIEVFTLIRGVYFAVTLAKDVVTYTSLAARPEGV